jgi:DNA-binding NarL/FixJ family response regulator
MRTTVFIVDDHDGFRARARALLEAEGFDVVGDAADGGSGLAAVERLRPEVALVDVGLPDIDGFAVAAEIRRAGSARKVILISGRAREDFGERIAGSLADGFIGKAELSGENLAEALG